MTNLSDFERILSPGGPIAQFHPNYEYRPGQVRMAEAVADAFESRYHLCVEAGTGTGKTLAYLLPAIASRKRVIVSTGTKNLQEQLFFRDVPFLVKALGRPLSVCYMKGRSNYLCLKKLAEIGREGFLFAPKDLEYLPTLREWAEVTETGDRAELRDLPDDVLLWRQVDARRETCTGQKCPDFDACFVTRVRQRALESDIVIVNHHLFFADLALRHGDFGSVLPDYAVVVFDEAHELEDVATQYFGSTVSNFRLDELARDAQRALAEQSEAPAFLLQELARLATASTAFFAIFRRTEGRSAMEEFGSGLHARRGPRQPGRLSEAYRELSSRLAIVGAGCSNLPAPTDATDAIARRSREIADDLAVIMEAESSASVYWYECRGRGVYLWASPISVAPLLRERLFPQVDSVVLTSATLATGGNFDFIRSRLGMDEAHELILGSHYDFSRQAILYVPRDIPEPRDSGWLKEACRELEAILEASHGRAFLLFTSYAQMTQVRRELEDRLPYPLLMQGEMSKTGLLDAFRETPNAVLFGTSSFWQGVDVQGEQLSCVVIDKLPFSVPSDPVVAARIRNLNESGRNAFYEYQIPEAIILLKQGLGRLIRSSTDRGILAVLDKRIVGRSYGRVFLQSLPPAPLTQEIDSVRKFLG
jgi:ATP-dependent DNA helicase DinG